MPADAFIQCRVTPEMKTRVRALAEREQITESALVKELLQVVLRTAALQAFPKLDELDRPNRDARLYVRLEPEDRQLLTGRATQRGMPSATYVSLLVRTHLRGVAPLPKEELLALRHSIAELKTAGRLGRRCRCRTCPYLNNIVEQDHRAIKRRVNASQGFRSFHGARRTIQGYEVVHMIRKGQVRWLPKGDVLGLLRLLNQILGLAG